MVTAPLPLPVAAAIEPFQRFLNEKRFASSAPWTLARTLLVDAAERLCAHIGMRQPPAQPERIAQLLRVGIRTLSPNTARSGMHGRLIWSTQGLVAEVVGSLEESRARFTLAHELGHALFYRVVAEHAERIVPVPLLGSAGEKREEGLCNAFAAVILMPVIMMDCLDDVFRRPPSLTGVQQASDVLQVSPEALLPRVLHDLGHWRDACFLFVKNRRDDSPGSWSVRPFYGAQSRGHMGDRVREFKQSLLATSPTELVRAMHADPRWRGWEARAGRFGVWINAAMSAQSPATERRSSETFPNNHDDSSTGYCY